MSLYSLFDFCVVATPNQPASSCCSLQGAYSFVTNGAAKPIASICKLHAGGTHVFRETVDVTVGNYFLTPSQPRVTLVAGVPYCTGDHTCLMMMMMMMYRSFQHPSSRTSTGCRSNSGLISNFFHSATPASMELKTYLFRRYYS